MCVNPNKTKLTEKERINILIKKGKEIGWEFIRDTDPDAGGNFCGFYHGDPAADLVYYKGKLRLKHVLKAFSIALKEAAEKEMNNQVDALIESGSIVEIDGKLYPLEECQ